jgi:ribonuclease P protein subunit RPR2
MSKNKMQDIAVERMYRLDELARKANKKHPERSKRYAQLILQLASKYKASIPKEVKGSFCRKCYVQFTPNTVQEIVKGNIITKTCKKCGKKRSYSKE